MTLEDTVSPHDKNIEKLVNEFGSQLKEEIRLLYDTERDNLEKEATIPQFIPVFAYKHVKNLLSSLYKQDKIEMKD